jgi:hypothetical protein
MGVSYNWVHYRLKGHTSVHADEVPDFARALGVPILTLYGMEPGDRTLESTFAPLHLVPPQPGVGSLVGFFSDAVKTTLAERDVRLDPADREVAQLLVSTIDTATTALTRVLDRVS